jgi:hypothetical protein
MRAALPLERRTEPRKPNATQENTFQLTKIPHSEAESAVYEKR